MDPFRRFEGEEVKERRLKEGKDSPTGPILDVFEDFLVQPSFHRACGRMEKGLDGIKYGSSEVEEFCSYLECFEDYMDFSYKTGMFLTSLVNRMEGESAIVDLRDLERSITHLGYGLRGKRLEAYGDVMTCLGMGMESGELVLHGDAKSFVGHEMRGGRIEVRGRVRIIGEMEGGVVEVGELLEERSLDYIRGGEVWVKGKLAKKV